MSGWGFWVFLAAFEIPLAVVLWRYVRAVRRRTALLEAAGWTCVGVDLLAGPVMVPPLGGPDKLKALTWS